MKKIITLIVIIFIAALIFISVIPDYKESQRPFNKLVTYAKAEGFALGILLPNPSMQKKADMEVVKLEKKIERTVPVKYFSGSEAKDISQEQRISVPGYILLDGDGNVAAKESDVFRAGAVLKFFTDLHTH